MRQLFWSLFLSCLAVGCAPRERPSQRKAMGEEAAPVHTEGQGILLCETTKRSIGLKTVTVSEVREGDGSLLVVPSSAVLNTTLGSAVYVGNGEHFKRTLVTLGRADGDSVEITAGVCEADTVVSEAAQMLWLIELRAVKGGKGCCPMPESDGDAEAGEHRH